MYEGWAGSWRFYLPYTAEPGNGGYLFLFYLALGHFARITGLSLLTVFHLARILSACVLIIAIYYFINEIFPGNNDFFSKSFALILLGSGLGWILLPFGLVTSDFLVPEAYPFLSSFTNPHFTIGLAIFLFVFIQQNRLFTLKRGIFIFAAGLLLSIIMPFGSMVMILVMLITILWDLMARQDMIWKSAFCFFLGASPYLLYVYWISTTEVVLSGWNLQNQTPSPPIWDLVISLAPGIILLYWSLRKLIGRLDERPIRGILTWFVMGLFLILIPFSLQRRFMFGIFIPTGILAVFGILYLIERYPQVGKWLWKAFLGVSVLTNISVLLITGFGIYSHSQKYYFLQTEYDSFNWIKSFTSMDNIILSSPEVGLLIPAYTGRRVIYGHPFETVNAKIELQNVDHFFDGWSKEQEKQFIESRHIDYIFFGPEEKKLGTPDILSDFPVVFKNEDVSIYHVILNHP
jgi:hypothetical protein